MPHITKKFDLPSGDCVAFEKTSFHQISDAVVAAEHWGYLDDRALRCRAYHLAPVDASLRAGPTVEGEALEIERHQSGDDGAVVAMD